MGGDFSRSENYRSGTSTVDLTPTSPRPGSPTSTSVSSAATLNKWDNLCNINVTFSNVNPTFTINLPLSLWEGTPSSLPPGLSMQRRTAGARFNKKQLIWSTILVVFRRGQLATTVRSAAGDPPGWIWDHRWSTRCLRWDWLLGNNVDHRKFDSDNPPDVGPRHRRRQSAELHTRCRSCRLQSG